MTYILLMVVLTVVPILAGNSLGRRRAAQSRSRLPAVTAILAAVAWAGLSWFARRRADTDLPGWPVAEWWAHSGKWFFFLVFGQFLAGFATGREHEGMPRRRIILASAGMLIILWTVVWRTIPVYAFLPRSVTRDENGFVRQSVQYTCAPVALANLLEQYHGFTNVTERELARLSRTTYEGTTTPDLIRAAGHYGLRPIACRAMTVEELERAAKPAIVNISTTPGVRHATLVVGFRDDEVVTTDPDRGIYVFTRERFRDVFYGKALILDR